jgi:AcrR family transcriptional regulator
LLNSTVDCLAEYGYPNVTGAQIAARAGVTRGAQAHYFATKTELVVAALEHATERITKEFRESPPLLGSEAETVLALMDRLWELHRSPAFTAVVELWLAGRTDPELRTPVTMLNKHLTSAIAEVLAEIVPEFLARCDGAAVVTTALAAIRGATLAGFVADGDSVEVVWRITREQVGKLVDAAVAAG